MQIYRKIVRSKGTLPLGKGRVLLHAGRKVITICELDPYNKFMKLIILAIGKLKGPEAELCAEYQKRIKSNLTVKELSGGTQKEEGAALLKAIPERVFVVLCDERGKDLSSREMAEKYAAWTARDALVFLIGGADGVTDEVRKRADFVLGLGRKTWPHRLVRVMLLEQIYRAQQINAGHPYHRD